MHDIMVTLAFVTMVVIPAIVAFQSPESSKEDKSSEMVPEQYRPSGSVL